MKMKRFVTLLLALAMVLTCCSFAMADEIPDIKLTGTVNQYGWEVPEETIKFTMYACGDDQTNQAESDANMAVVDAVLKDEFNMEIDKLVYSQDATERLNFMLAANDYPEVIVGLSDTMANAFISQGRAIELTPYLEKYGQNVLATYGNYINLLKEDDGSLYKLSSCIGNTTDLMGRDFSIRWDWLQETGLPVPNSFESYYEAIKACVANHPTNENGEKVYGITAFTLKGEEFYQVPLLYQGFYSAPTGVYKLNEDGTITHWVDTEEGRQVAHYINKFWQDGLIDPDFQTKDYDTSKAFMSSERVAGNIGTWWHNLVGSQQIWETTDPNYDVYTKHFRDITWEENGITPNLIGNNYIRTDRVILTDKCQHPEEIVKFMDWQTSPVGVAFISMGPAGEDRAWHFTDDGLIEINDWYWNGKPGDLSFSWDDFETKQCGGWNYQIACPGYTPVNAMDDPAKGWAYPIKYVNMWDLLPNYAELDPATRSNGNTLYVLNGETSGRYLYDLTSWNVSIDPDSDVATVQEDINDRLVSDWCYCVMAEDDAACDAAFDKMVSDLHDLGLEDLVAAQEEAFETNQKKLDGSYFAK